MNKNKLASNTAQYYLINLLFLALIVALSISSTYSTYQDFAYYLSGVVSLIAAASITVAGIFSFYALFKVETVLFKLLLGFIALSCFFGSVASITDLARKNELAIKESKAHELNLEKEQNKSQLLANQQAKIAIIENQQKANNGLIADYKAQIELAQEKIKGYQAKVDVGNRPETNTANIRVQDKKINSLNEKITKLNKDNLALLQSIPEQPKQTDTVSADSEVIQPFTFHQIFKGSILDVLIYVIVFIQFAYNKSSRMSEKKEVDDYLAKVDVAKKAFGDIQQALSMQAKQAQEQTMYLAEMIKLQASLSTNIKTASAVSSEFIAAKNNLVDEYGRASDAAQNLSSSTRKAEQLNHDCLDVGEALKAQLNTAKSYSIDIDKATAISRELSETLKNADAANEDGKAVVVQLSENNHQSKKLIEEIGAQVASAYSANTKLEQLKPVVIEGNTLLSELTLSTNQVRDELSRSEQIINKSRNERNELVTNIKLSSQAINELKLANNDALVTSKELKKTNDSSLETASLVKSLTSQCESLASQVKFNSSHNKSSLSSSQVIKLGLNALKNQVIESSKNGLITDNQVMSHLKIKDKSIAQSIINQALASGLLVDKEYRGKKSQGYPAAENVINFSQVKS